MQPVTSLPTNHVDLPNKQGKKRARNENSSGDLSGRTVTLPSKTSKTASESPKKTALIEHLGIFADDEGNINASSVYNKLTKLHMGMFEAGSYAAIITLGCTLINKAPYINVNDLGKYTTLSDLSCFKPDGSVDEDGLTKLLSYAQPDKNFLSSIDIKRMLSEVNFQSNAYILSGAASSSWDLLQRLCTDHWEKIDGTWVPCLTKATITQYIKDSKGLFKRVEDGELPIKQPSD